MTRSRLLEMVRDSTQAKLAGYGAHPLHMGDLTDVIVAAYSRSVKIGSPQINAGLLGGFLLGGARPS